MQQGGQPQADKSQIIAAEIDKLLQQGVNPQQIVQEFLAQGIDEWDIKDALMTLGMPPSEADLLFAGSNEAQQMSNQEPMEEQPQEMPEEEFAEPELQTGIFGNTIAQYGGSIFPGTINQHMSMLENGYRKDPGADYLPMDLGMKGNPLGAAMMFADAATDLFSSKEDPNTGLKKGFFRDAKTKRAIQKNNVPNYYNYNITQDPNDSNLYVNDKQDLYNAATGKGSLRTQEQYKKDLNEFSRIKYNADNDRYDFLMSSRKTDPNTLSINQRNQLKEFMTQGAKPNDFKDRFDPETKKMINLSQKEGMGSLGISPSGEASSYMTPEDNPYLYNTMMGINTLDSELPSVVMQYGGEPPLEFKEWHIQNGVTIGDQNPQKLYEEYLKQFQVGPPKEAFEQFQNEFYPQQPQTPTPGFQQPQVEITNKVQGDLNRFKDSRFLEGYGKVSNIAVQGAGFINEMFKERKRKKAEGDLYEMTQADNIFGYYEDPVNKQGSFDVNTGLLEQNNYVPYMKQGGDFNPHMMYKGGKAVKANTHAEHLKLSDLGYGHTKPKQYGGTTTNELDLDPDTIAQLISAGADIEIL